MSNFFSCCFPLKSILSNRFVHKYGYTHFSLDAICLECQLLPLHYEPLFDSVAEMDLLKATYSWVLFFNTSCYSVFFDW